MKTLAKILPFGASLLPVLALAQDTASDASAQFGYLTGVVKSLGNLIGLLIPVIIAIGLLLFIWGLVQYIANSGDEGAKEEGKRKMIWGIVTLFVIVSVWGLVLLLNQLTGVDQGESYTEVQTGLDTYIAPDP